MTTLSCGHKYCHTCLRTVISTASADESIFPPKCCNIEVPSDAISAVLPFKDLAAYKAKVAEYATPWESRLHCSRANCGAWIPPDPNSGSSRVMCLKCFHKMCRHCRGRSHPSGTDCPEDTDLAAVLEVAKSMGWMRCYKCNAMVERSSGCRHM